MPWLVEGDHGAAEAIVEVAAHPALGLLPHHGQRRQQCQAEQRGERSEDLGAEAQAQPQRHHSSP